MKITLPVVLGIVLIIALYALGHGPWKIGMISFFNAIVDFFTGGHAVALGYLRQTTLSSSQAVATSLRHVISQA